MTQDPRALEELSQFLADFVRRGELEDPLPGDERPEVWRQRMDWWWTRNPFCRDDSNTGWLLREETGRIVGFQGLIPLDFTIGDKAVPGLLSCLFFVEKGFRGQSMGLFFRMQRLSRQFHLVDGGPSGEMTRILERFHYERGDTRTFYFLPAVLRHLSRLPSDHNLITDPGSVREILPARDGRLRRRVTRESLEWLLKAGRHPRQFLGVLDAEGRLVAHAIGTDRRLPGGLRALQIIDYGADDEAIFSVEDLLNEFRSLRGRRKLSPSPHLFLWGIENGARHPRTILRMKKPSKVFFQRPESCLGVEKVILPIEGDFCFF